MEAEATRSAAHVFAAQNLGATSARAGLLIYLSLFEREFVILADRRAYQALGQDGLGRLKDIALKRAKSSDRVEAFTATIAAAAGSLAQKLPAPTGDTNDLSNLVVCFHPRP